MHFLSNDALPERHIVQLNGTWDPEGDEATSGDNQDEGIAPDRDDRDLEAGEEHCPETQPREKPQIIKGVEKVSWP